MKNKRKTGLSLNKKVISSLEARQVVGGALQSGVACATQEGSCQTTSCVCTDNEHCAQEPKKPGTILSLY